MQTILSIDWHNQPRAIGVRFETGIRYKRRYPDCTLKFYRFEAI